MSQRTPVSMASVADADRPADAPPADGGTGDADARWHRLNAFGVMLATDGEWQDARHAFEDGLAAAPSREDDPGAHAILLSNLAQARFHTGDIPGAIESARASMAARLTGADEDDALVARSRADLAVYLAASGAVDEARAALHHAITSLEHAFGAHDDRLLVPLENEVVLEVLAHADAPAGWPPAPPVSADLSAAAMSCGERAQGTDAPEAGDAGGATDDLLNAMGVFPVAGPIAPDLPGLELVEPIPDAPPPRRPAVPAFSLFGTGEPLAPGTGAAASPEEARDIHLGFAVRFGVPDESTAPTPH
jgi:hypothetical protein